MSKMGTPGGVREPADADSGSQPVQPGDPLPSVWGFRGFGKQFFGGYDPRDDRSRVRIHCVFLFNVPVWPLGAWRVRSDGGFDEVLAREPLPRWARVLRWAVPAVVVLGIAAAVTLGWLFSDQRAAEQRWDAAIEAGAAGDPAAALRRLDDEFQRDAAVVDQEHLEHGGPEVIRLAVRAVPSPITPTAVDQASRVVARFHALPERASGPEARAALIAALERWLRELDTAAVDARLAVLAAAVDVAQGPQRDQLAAQIADVRLAAAAKLAGAPLDALPVLLGGGNALPSADRARLIVAADAVVARLAESPSLLLDAEVDLDAWAAATRDGATRSRITELRAKAKTGRDEAQADGVTPAQLADMATRRPWDQFVVLQLARQDTSDGKLDAAAARIAGLGAPGLTIRDARFLAAQITAERGDLAAADAQLDALLAGRLPRLVAAERALDETIQRAGEQLENRLRTGSVPNDLRERVDAASGDAARNEIVNAWIREQLQSDPDVGAARVRYQSLASVVPIALAAGSIKLRRAQALSGPAHNAMLQAAERTFLAIRSEAEGQPAFRLALGEIYARLGKTAESDAELGAVLAKRDPQLSLAVAHVYRGLGSLARAREIARGAYAAASGPLQLEIAASIAVMANDDGNETDAEQWYRKADPHSPHVRAALLEFEAARLSRSGDATACAAKFAQAAKLHLSIAGVDPSAAYNNAALAYERGFDCSGDPRAMRDAEATLDRAYRAVPDGAIVVGNLTAVVAFNRQLHVLARRVDLSALRLQLSDLGEVMEMLLDGPDRDAVRAELLADPATRRIRELITQFAVLAPNNPAVFSLQFGEARLDRDAAAAAAAVDRARSAPSLDHTQRAGVRERWLSGADDAIRLGDVAATRTRAEAALAGPAGARLDPRTRSVAQYLRARSLATLGLYRAEPALLAEARTAAVSSWPALDPSWVITSALIDEAALAGDAKAWIALRRARSASSAIDALIARGDPLAAKIRSSPQWAAVAANEATDRRMPSIGKLRLARSLGDAALEARARPVLDDKLAQLERELTVTIDPGDDDAKSDLAYFKAR